jgi:hypothetical protein
MEAVPFSETSVLTRATQLNIQEDGILHRIEKFVNFKTRVEFPPPELQGFFYRFQGILKAVYPYIPQENRVSGLCASPSILKLENTTIRKLDLFREI